MIRTFRPQDLDALLSLWLAGNLDAHPFIPAEYWKGQADAVRELLPQAELLVYDAGAGPVGFLGLDGSYIAGIFVDRAARSQGIGRALLDAAKHRRRVLTLHVYRDNPRAAAFYRRGGVGRCGGQGAAPTRRPELLFRWARG